MTASPARPSLAERPVLRMVTLCVLYVAQGIPWGFTAITLPTYIATHGATEAGLGSVIAMTTLPYTFKWVWGPLMDAFTLPRFGRRRPWIVGAQAMMALSIGAFLWTGTADTQALAWLVFVNTVFSSIQDVAVDGLAVDLVPESERGRATGFTYAAKYGGGMLGAGGLGYVVVHAGMRAALLVQVVVLVAIMLVPLLVRERGGESPPLPKLLAVVKSLARAFSLRSTLLCAAAMLAANLASGMLSVASLTLYTEHLHWTQERLTPITGIIGPAVGLGGAALAGVLADRVGHKRLAVAGVALLGAGWLVFVLMKPYWGGTAITATFLAFEVAGQAIASVALMAVCMDVSWPRVGASQFAAYMALMNLSTTLGAKYLAPALAGQSYRMKYVIGALLQLPLVLLLGLIDTRQTRRVLGGEPAELPSARVV